MPCAVMAMKMKINSMLHIFIVWTCLHLPVVRLSIDYNVITWGPICGEYRNDSPFLLHLKEVLESVVVNVSTSHFSISSVGENSNGAVYGLAQCREDLNYLNSSYCKLCASMSKAILADKCDNSTSGFILTDGCFLRYDNHYFYNYTEGGPTNGACAGPVTSGGFSSVVDNLLIDITKKALQNPKLFATDVIDVESSPSKLIYTLAQCWGDLSKTSCQSCLDTGRSNIAGLNASNISECVNGAIGGHFNTMGCNLRYEIYNFINTPSPIPSPSPPLSPGESPGQSPPVSGILPPLSPGESPGQSPPVSGGRKREVLAITLGVVAAAVGLMATIWLLCFRRKRWEQISRTGGSEIAKSFIVHLSSLYLVNRCSILLRKINRCLVIVFAGDKVEISLRPPLANPELIFKYHTLREATSNFKAENKLGEGGFGSVFKGVLPDGIEVAVKRLNIGSKQGDNEFLSEANLISRVQHKNLVKLLGWSVESSERLLVYEYLENSSLDKILFDITKRHLLDWRERFEIIVGTARGLAYLHEESHIRIIHRDIKASNILLDNKHKPKIADFGLAKLFAEDQTHVSTKIAGTLGYMAPEYALRGQLTEKADVFSFGVLVLEIISGRKNQSLPQHMEFLIEATWRLYNSGRAIEVMDPTLEGSYSWEEAIRVIKIGLLCTQAGASLRPSMSRVVSMFTSEQDHIPSPTRPACLDLDSVLGVTHQVEGARVTRQDPDNIQQ